MAAKFYDHAKNQNNANVGFAMAKARRDAINDGDAYEVFFSWGKGEQYWNGCFHDCLALAKELRFGGAVVEMRHPQGGPVDINQRF